MTGQSHPHRALGKSIDRANSCTLQESWDQAKQKSCHGPFYMFIDPINLTNADKGYMGKEYLYCSPVIAESLRCDAPI